MRQLFILDPSGRNRYVSDGVYYIVRRAPKRFLGQLSQFSYPSVQCTGLISWREKPKKGSCVVVVRRLDAFPSLPGIVPHRKKERGAPARPVGPLT